jgi:hypothetical protein
MTKVELRRKYRQWAAEEIEAIELIEAVGKYVGSPSPQTKMTGVLPDLLKLIEAIPKADRGFSWEARDWHGNEAIRAYNENAKVLKFLLDNTEQVAADIRAALTTEGQL